MQQTIWTVVLRGIVCPLTCAGLFFVAVTSGQAQTTRFSDVPANHWAADSVNKLVGIGILQGATKKPTGKTASNYDGNKPVTRYELAVTLYRFVQYIERADKQPKSKLGAEVDGPKAVELLVKGGYLPASSPLVKDGAKLVTANQLADAMGQVIAKAREKRVPISPGSKYAPD